MTVQVPNSTSRYPLQGNPVSSPTVFIVDDDAGIRYSLAALLSASNLPSECFAGAKEFLRTFDPDRAGCLVLDVRMPGMDGMQLHQTLGLQKNRMPVIFLTAYGDLDVGIEAMKQGAMDFLTKPINSAKFMERVHTALERDRELREVAAARRSFEKRLSSLTPREWTVLELALWGKSSREISEQLSISKRTVDGHRERIRLKLDVDSLATLGQMAASTGVVLKMSAHTP